MSDRPTARYYIMLALFLAILVPTFIFFYYAMFGFLFEFRTLARNVTNVTTPAQKQVYNNTFNAVNLNYLLTLIVGIIMFVALVYAGYVIFSYAKSIRRSSP